MEILKLGGYVILFLVGIYYGSLCLGAGLTTGVLKSLRRIYNEEKNV
jgi:hypothetical protein